MEKLEKFKFYAFNLNGGDDTRIPAKLYCQLFGWTMKTESIGHTEVKIAEDLYVIFSRPTENCPVETGTLTFVMDSFPLSLGELFKIDLNTKVSKKYRSYLDHWGNRIWIYLST